MGKSAIPILTLGDVLTPIATLIGLLAAALGLMIGAKLDPSLSRTLGYVMVVIILFFVATAVCSLAASATQRASVWGFSTVLYATSWITFGIGLIFMVVAFVYGPNAFSIPQLGTGETSAVSTGLIGATVALILSEVLSERSERKSSKRVEEQLKRLMKGVERSERKLSRREKERLMKARRQKS